MSRYSELVSADRRLVVLRLLYGAPRYVANEHLLVTALETYGHSIGHDRLKADLAWLQEQELIEVEEISGVWIARLTARGKDVAEGRSTVPGVKRPEPES